MNNHHQLCNTWAFPPQGREETLPQKHNTQEETSPQKHNCPLCRFAHEDAFVLQLHVDETHFGSDDVANDPPPIAAFRKLTGSDEASPYFDAPSSKPAHNDTDELEYLTCPLDDCDEEVLNIDLAEHLDFHTATGLDLDEELRALNNGGSFSEDSALRVNGNSSVGLLRNTRPLQRESPIVKRLGKQELGPHAFELQMPARLLAHLTSLAAGKSNRTVNKIACDGSIYRHVTIENQLAGIVPLLHDLLESSTSSSSSSSLANMMVEEAWLCHAGVEYVFRTEGSFCGYLNVMMLFSYLRDRGLWPLPRQHSGDDDDDAYCHRRGPRQQAKHTAAAAAAASSAIPGVLELQDMIEDAWDKGFSSHARVETGGIRGTRKYIGTSEVEALFKSLDVPCSVKQLSSTSAGAFGGGGGAGGGGKLHASALLLDYVDDYFSSAATSTATSTSSAHTKTHHGPTHNSTNNKVRGPPAAPPRIHQTTLPPIYLQQPGHSMTIIGIAHHHHHHHQNQNQNQNQNQTPPHPSHLRPLSTTAKTNTKTNMNTTQTKLLKPAPKNPIPNPFTTTPTSPSRTGTGTRTRSLIILDPAFKPSPGILKMIEQRRCGRTGVGKVRRLNDGGKGSCFGPGGGGGGSASGFDSGFAGGSGGSTGKEESRRKGEGSGSGLLGAYLRPEWRFARFEEFEVVRLGV